LSSKIFGIKNYGTRYRSSQIPFLLPLCIRYSDEKRPGFVESSGKGEQNCIRIYLEIPEIDKIHSQI